MLVVGAGITGIYQLYRAREAGFSAELLEAGDGVGGTWYWNRYPGARFDSESYTYAYLFSQDLFEEWEWQEQFAEQPETERYLNHVVDRFDLRRNMRFGARVTAAIYDETSATWSVETDDGRAIRARFVVAATGSLSVPYFPAVPGHDEFRGESFHTGLWPATPVDFAGKRVAVIGTGSSGVQLIPEIAGEVASLTVYQRSANWCTPLNNAPITAAEQAQLRADFAAIRETLNTSASGFLHLPHDRATFDDSEAERAAFFEKMWNSPGFAKLTSHYTDLLFDHDANAEWCEFLAEKIRGIVTDPETAAKLIPTPPFRREAAALRERLLRGVQQRERLTRRSGSDAGPAHDRARHRDRRRRAGVRHRGVGHRLRLRDRCAPADGYPRTRRHRARRRVGRRSADVRWACRAQVSPTSSFPADRTRRPATTRGTTATSSTSSPTRSSTHATTATTPSRSIRPRRRSGPT